MSDSPNIDVEGIDVHDDHETVMVELEAWKLPIYASLLAYGTGAAISRSNPDVYEEIHREADAWREMYRDQFE